MSNVSFLQDLLNGIAERGRTLLPRALTGSDGPDDMVDLASALVSGRGEASGVALARQILTRYGRLDEAQRREFFAFLADSLGPDYERIATAAGAFTAAPSADSHRALARAMEPRRQEFFRRLNLAPGATAAIVAMRRDMLAAMRDDTKLAAVDVDLMHLLVSWFNRGFLVLRRIDWSTPANILEKIIAYEAVHEIQGWDDLRRRLDPVDRRCFAFFHPSLVDEPLIFVEVALTRAIPGSIQDLLSEEKVDRAKTASTAPTTAVFYSISNCQDGLRGISFGNFLIKQVVEELVRDIPSLKTFITLSPVPGFAAWLAEQLAGAAGGPLSQSDRLAVQMLADPAWADDPDGDADIEQRLLALAAHYFIEAKTASNRPPDPVARFHLGNGARLERINWRGDVSRKGLREAHGLMVNYLYEIKDIEKNHEIFANTGAVVASRAVRGLLRPAEKPRASVPAATGTEDTPPARPNLRLAPPAPAEPKPGRTEPPAGKGKVAAKPARNEAQKSPVPNPVVVTGRPRKDPG